jgi:hypothetical protein
MLQIIYESSKYPKERANEMGILIRNINAHIKPTHIFSHVTKDKRIRSTDKDKKLSIKLIVRSDKISILYPKIIRSNIKITSNLILILYIILYKNL